MLPRLNLKHLPQRGCVLLPARSAWYHQLKSKAFISCGFHYPSHELSNNFMVSLLNSTLTKTSNTTSPLFRRNYIYHREDFCPLLSVFST